MSAGSAEATAPCAVDLTGGGWDLWPEAAGTAVAVAVDRRAWCRVELGGRDVEILSRDAVQTTSAPSVRSLRESGREPVVAGVLEAMGLEGGLRVETRSPVPRGSGLGESSAMAAAVAGAAHAVLGRAAAAVELARLLKEARSEGAAGGVADVAPAAALHGGTVALRQGTEVESLPADPARVQESLLLVDSGSRRPAADAAETAAPGGAHPEAEAARARLARLGDDVAQALIEGRYEDVVELMAEEWELRKRVVPRVSTSEIDRIIGLARAAGGAGRACGPGPGGLVALWAPPGARGPGRREALEKALSAAGLRAFPARVDLLGLDVG